MVIDATLLNTRHYKVRIKGKVEQSGKGVAPSLTPWYSSYWKGSLLVTFDYGPQLYFLLLQNKEEIFQKSFAVLSLYLFQFKMGIVQFKMEKLL